MATGTAVQTSIPDEPIDDLPADAADPHADADVDAAREVEARAREMGWKPLTEYRGPPGRWQPAAEFIARGENILPIVRDQNRRLTERVGKLEGEITGLRRTAEEQLQVIRDLREMGQRADQAGYNRAMADIKAQQRQAVERGDTTAYDQLVEQQEALMQSRATAPKVEPPKTETPPAQPQGSPAVKDFVAENRSWFNKDPFLTRKMIDQHLDVVAEGEITDEAEQFAEAKRRLQEAYPERFGMARPAPQPPRPNGRRAAPVARPTPPAPPPSGTTAALDSIQDPAERAQAREAFNRMKRQMPDYTEGEYMALYNDPHSDVLEMHKPRSQPNVR